jgi:hypothetical protein
MSTTRQDIDRWLAAAPPHSTHMVVVCDTFSHEDYPVYVCPEADVRDVVKKYDGPNMQRIMEVYSFQKPLRPQIEERRAYHLD